MDYGKVTWQNVDNICRLCLSKSNKMSEIFTEAVGNNLPNVLFKKITSIVDIQIDPNDGFPTSICTACEKQVEQFYQFQLMVEHSDRTLRCFQPLDSDHDDVDTANFDVVDDDCLGEVTEVVDIDNPSSNCEILSTPTSNLENNICTYSTSSNDDIYKVSSAEEKNANVQKPIKNVEKKYKLVRIKAEVDEIKNEPDDFEYIDDGDPDLEVETNFQSKFAEIVDEAVNDEDDDLDFDSMEDTENSERIFSCKLCNNCYDTFDALKNHVMDHCFEPKRRNSTLAVDDEIDSDEYESKRDDDDDDNDGADNAVDEVVAKIDDANDKNIMMKEKKVICKHCKRTLLKMNIGKHLRKCRVRNRRYECGDCGQVFNKKVDLINHRQLHPLPSLLCEKCNKTFTRMQSLIVHIKRHVLGNRYICEVCGKGYFAHTELIRHAQTHTDRKKYPCPYCTKAFPTNPELTRHLKYHKGIKKFKCDLCNKCYYESGHLKVHLRKHTGEKPFGCQICNKAFVTKSKLIRHIKIHDKSQIERVYPDKKIPIYY